MKMSAKMHTQRGFTIHILKFVLTRTTAGQDHTVTISYTPPFTYIDLLYKMVFHE